MEGIRVARFPGEQCGIVRLSFRSHHIRSADVEEIAESRRLVITNRIEFEAGDRSGQESEEKDRP
jgi:hypothetical protein